MDPSQEPTQLVKGLIHAGSKVCLAGGSKSNKTWILLNLAISVALGVPWLGHETTRGKVLYVNFEVQRYFLLQRARAILTALGVEGTPELSFWNLRGYACSAEVIVPGIIEKIRTAGYSLVVIDPLYKLMGGRDENSAGDMGDLLNEFERIAVETGAAVVFGAHFSKGNQATKDAIDRTSGSGVFARDPDTILPITRHAEADAFVMEPILRNFPPSKPFVLRWEFPLMVRADDLDPADLKQAKGPRKNARHSPTLEEFLEIFPTPESDPGRALLTNPAISEAFKERNWDTGMVRSLKTEAILAGRLQRQTGAHNKQVIGRPEAFTASELAALQLQIE